MPDDRDISFYIPENFAQSNRLFGFRKRNLIEAACGVFLVIYLVGLIPFVFKVRLIVTVALSVVVAARCAYGIRNRSMTEWFMDYVHYKRSGQVYHLRTIKEKKKSRMEETDEYGQRLSYVEQLWRIIKKTVQEGDKDGIKELAAKAKERVKGLLRRKKTADETGDNK